MRKNVICIEDAIRTICIDAALEGKLNGTPFKAHLINFTFEAIRRITFTKNVRLFQRPIINVLFKSYFRLNHIPLQINIPREREGHFLWALLSFA